jgi:hypothetical protein
MKIKSVAVLYVTVRRLSSAADRFTLVYFIYLREELIHSQHHLAGQRLRATRSEARCFVLCFVLYAALSGHNCAKLRVLRNTVQIRMAAELED